MKQELAFPKPCPAEPKHFIHTLQTVLAHQLAGPAVHASQEV